MEQQQLEGILKTTEGLEAVIRLLASLYYAPTGSDFFRFDHDPYTTKLRVFVRQVQSVIPESHHAKHSATCLEGLQRTRATTSKKSCAWPRTWKLRLSMRRPLPNWRTYAATF